MKYQTIEKHISEIKPGDTVIREGKLQTVCPNNLKHCRLMGKSLFGDSYMSGHKLVQVAVIEKVKVN